MFNVVLDVEIGSVRINVPGLDERIEKINKFLSICTNCDYRHFGIFLIPPGKTQTGNIKLAKRQSETQYRLCLECFDSNGNYNEDLELLFDIGKTARLYRQIYSEVLAISYLCSFQYHSIILRRSNHSLSIAFEFDDDERIERMIRNHLNLLSLNN